MQCDRGRSVSVVIPTYERADLLVATVRSVLDSDIDGLVRVELIIVDDGSMIPAASVLAAIATPPGWTVRILRQDNAGVGAARNAGYRVASEPIVLFVDDDMLLLPGTLLAHVEAHRSRPDAVVFGRSPYVEQVPDRFTTWVLGLDNDPHGCAMEAMIPATVVASGHLSVERTGPMASWPDFYADDMRTPVAEEYELSSRLARSGVAVYVGRDIVAFHNRTIDVDTFLAQQFGHGRGCVEAARRHPECLALDELRTIVSHHRRRSLHATAWRVLATTPARSVLRRAARRARTSGWGPLAPAVFNAASGAWFAAGLRSCPR